MVDETDTLAKIIPLPRPGIPARYGATAWQIAAGRLREMVGNLANRLRVPAFVRPAVIEDELTGQTIVIEPGHLLTRISVGGRDYYFGRFSGRFDGVGISVEKVVSLEPPRGYRRGRARR
jgi:hypothetical protein